MPAPYRNIPIIALTAYASKIEKDKAMSIGMSDYITKPYSPNELLSAILRQVGKSGKWKDQKITREVIRKDDITASTEKLLTLFSNNREDVLSLLQMLVGQIPQLVRESEQHIKAENWPSTFQSVHKLKSSITLLKITTLKNLITELEEYSREQIKTERIQSVFDQFKAACDDTVSLLQDEILRLKKI